MRTLFSTALAFGLAAIVGAGCVASGVSGSGACTGFEDLTKDPRNCGACGTVCKASEVCSGGSCTAVGDAGGGCDGACTDASGPATCTSGQTKCGGDGGTPYCATTATDPANCGVCGKACALNQTCVAGACTPDCSSDGGAQTVCAGDGGPAYCASLQTDSANCGVCGKACKVNEKCLAGACSAACVPAWIPSNTSWTQNNLTYASEILNSSYNPTNLLDNNVTTRWVTASTTNQWVIFNFGAAMTLSGIQILNQANYTANSGGKDTILQTGPALVGPWTNVTSFQVANQQSSAQTFNFAAATSQYWRVFVQNNWGYPSYIQFMEVGFYGCP